MAKDKRSGQKTLSQNVYGMKSSGIMLQPHPRCLLQTCVRILRSNWEFAPQADESFLTDGTNWLQQRLIHGGSISIY